MPGRSLRGLVVALALGSVTLVTACGSTETSLPSTGTAPVGTSSTTTSAPKATTPVGTKAPTTTTTTAPVTTAPTTAKPTTTKKPPPKVSTTVFVTTSGVRPPVASTSPQSTDPFCRSIAGFRPTDQDGKSFPDAFNDWQAAIIGAHQSAPPEFEASLRLISDTFQTAKPLVESGQIANRDQLYKWLQQQGPEVVNATVAAANAYRDRCLGG